MPSTTLIIPAYNEAQRLTQFLAKVATYVAEHPTMLQEIIVVDDGSSDDTAAIAKSFSPQIPCLKVLSHATNKGKGGAVQTGVLAAKSDLIIFMDADGATAITELPKMIQALSTADVAVGNRWMPGAITARSSIIRRLSGWIYRHYMSWFGLGAIDTMCGFKGYQADVARDLFTNLLEQRWLFDTEVAYKAVAANYTIVNFPIAWQSMDGSKLDTKTLLKSAFQIWPLLRRIRKQL